MSKRNLPNDFNDDHPSKRFKISKMEQEETKEQNDIQQKIITFTFTAGNANHQQEIIQRTKALHLNDYTQKHLIADLFFHSLKAVQVSQPKIAKCIALLFEKADDCEMKVQFDAESVDESDADASDVNEDHSTDVDDLDNAQSQTPESQRYVANSDDNDFINREGDDNAHMIQSDVECEEADEELNESDQYRSSSSDHNATEKEESSSVCF